MSQLRPRDAYQILSRALELWWHNLGLILAIVAIVGVPLWAFRWALDSLADSTLTVVIAAVVVALVSWLASSFTQAAEISAASELHLGGTTTWQEAYRRGLPRVITILKTGALLGLALLGMAITVIGIPFAIYFLVRWSLFGEAIVLEEGLTPTKALSRSSELVQGNWWRVAGVSLLLFLITIPFALLAFLVVYPISLLLGLVDLPWLADLFATLLYSLAGAIFLYVGHTVLYYDLRARRGEEIPLLP